MATTTSKPRVNTTLLPHLAGWEDGEPAGSPWEYGPWENRKALLESLPARVWPLVLCEYARSVLPVWLTYSTTDTRPQRAIDARAKWCRVPSAADAARAAYAAGAAGAAYVAYAADAAQWRWMRAVYESAKKPVEWNPDWCTATVRDLCEAIWAAPFGERQLGSVSL